MKSSETEQQQLCKNLAFVSLRVSGQSTAEQRVLEYPRFTRSSLANANIVFC